MSLGQGAVFGRILGAALIAGAAAGLVTWAVHTLKAVPLILEAETYEHAQVADGATAPAAGARDAAVSGAEAQAFESPLDRRAMVMLIADLGLGVGFALALIGLIVLSGRDVDFGRGLLWGLGGFAAFAAAPALGLPPELPGIESAPVLERQIWWLATALCTGSGIGLLFLARRIGFRLAGAVIVVVPHIIGAPQLVGAPRLVVEALAVPAELAAEFAAVSLVATALFWLILGGLGGHVYKRLGQD